MKYELGVIGAGKIGSGIVKGLIEKKAIGNDSIIVSDVSDVMLDMVKREYGINITKKTRSFLHQDYNTCGKQI